MSRTFLISLLAPFYLGIFLLSQNPEAAGRIITFMTVLIFAMVLPVSISQTIRIKYPIKSARFADRWKWLGIAAVIMMAAVSTFYFTPIYLAGLLLRNAMNSYLFFKQGVEVLVIFMLIKIFAYLAGTRTSRTKEMPIFIDEYIAHSTPNIFLWISCISGHEQSLYLGFWACIIFFCGILADEKHFVHIFESNDYRHPAGIWAKIPIKTTWLSPASRYTTPS